jgi:alginate O-acetyltransferase complex protein AlgJ
MIVPVPVKPTVDGEMLSANVSGTQSLENGSFSQLKEELRRQAVRLFDPEPLLIEKKSASATGPLYLKSDTHWGAEAMEFVAQQLAANLHLPASSRGGTIRVEQKTITAPGDIARMLKLPAAETSRYRQEITVHQVMVGNGTWRASKDADVLLLGDSFSNIFSQSALGWGESAGFAEQLSRALGGRPLDCILRNSDGAFATREILARELARGRDRLATKKLVIWQFATRELAFGNWKLIDMRLRAPPPSHFFTPKSGEQTVVTGTIESLSPVPQPGSVPYADHIMAVHLVDVSTPQNGGADLESLVYLLSMRDNVWTTAARLRVGDQITVRLRPWADVAAAYEQINRSEVEDAAVQLEEPSWGELID